MSLNTLSNPLIIDWHKDIEGNKIIIPRDNINHVVDNNRFLLDYIPDSFEKVTFVSPSNMVEISMRDKISSSTQYKVDYTNGVVYVHQDLESTTVTISYYSRGVISFPAQRVYTKGHNGIIFESLDKKLNDIDKKYNDLMFDNIVDSVKLNDLYVLKGRENFIVKAGELVESFDNISDWVKESASGSLITEVNNVRYGDSSLKLTANSDDTFYDKSINRGFNGNGSISVLFYVDNIEGLNSIAIYFASDQWLASFFSKEIQAYELHQGWNYISISPYEWFVAGDESWENTFVKIRIRVNCTSGNPSVVFDSVYDNRQHKPKCLITFDDGHISSYTKGYTYMADNGLRGTHYLNGTSIGTNGFVNKEQLLEMYNQRWCLAGHGYYHDDLSTYSTIEEIKNDLILNEEFLKGVLGFPRSIKHLAYPYGGYNDMVIQALKDLGYKTARTIIDRDQGNYLDEPFLLTRMAVLNTTTIEVAKGFVDSAIVRGSACILNFHQIVDSNAIYDTQVLTSIFNELIDYIKTRVDLGLIDVVTIDEWYNGLKGYIRI